ncbi:LamG-like jellyroll fold domain-containing protein [Nodularia sp. NIES-3585]|uniref:LamG-like jellyroll fold domain-containing protein n=1 Tax=Nodularia sp. NIES-3585 TaxID=1973477 RepID=UPI000B5C96D7|nr:LamG-like jellyroll fold domain-containing protein [Nodularia sp. NIES-3585]GAX36560.1 hypothetical protein NIES3585_25950 [Nodularia sp. NIES-3585]
MNNQQCVLVFDGQNDYVDLGQKPEFKIPKNITVEAWICASSQRKWSGIFGNVFDTGLTESGYSLSLDGSSGIYFGLEPNSQGSQHMPYLSSGANTLNLNQWHHVAGSYDGQEIKVYVDGVLKATQAIACDSINYNTENNLTIGVYKDNNEFYPFSGKIAEVRLWNVARSEDEIKADMNRRLVGNETGLVGYWPLNECSGNTVTDKTGKGNNGTINGATWQEDELPVQTQTSQTVKPGPQGSTENNQQCVLVFDGQNDYVDLGQKPEFKIPKNITIEAWICASAQKEWSAILSNIFDTNLKESGYGLLLDGKSGIYFAVEPSSQGSQHMPYLSSGTNTLNLNQWHHVAGSYDGQQIKVYVDGVLKATQAIASDSINYNYENNLLIGLYKDDNDYYAFPGKIAEVRLWNVTRSEDEIKADMNRRLVGNETGLVGYWPLNECSGNTVTDKTGKGNNGTINGATWQEDELPIQTQTSQLAKQGPQGSTVKGTAYDIQPKGDAAQTRIKTLRVKAGWAVDNIQVEYETLDTTGAETYLSPACGGGGGNLVEFSLDADDYITEVIGSWGRQAPDYPKQEIVTLQFKTHKGVTSPVMGGGNAKKDVEPFSLKAPPDCEIIGFFGEHGNTLYNLGIYLQPVLTNNLVDDSEEAVAEFIGGEKTGTATGTIAIADISHKGQVNRTQSDEYVEIVNQGTETADLSGWKISSGLSKRQAFTFPVGSKLEAGKSFRVYTNEVHPETGGFSFGSGTAIWNDKGDEAKLFDTQGNQVSTLAYGASGIPGIKAELDVPQLVVKVSPSAINQQMAMGSKVTFVDALKLAIRSFLEDAEEIESPLGQMLNDPGAFDLPQGAEPAAATKVLRSYLNQPTSSLTLQSANSQYPPENGEKVDTNWIFLLQIGEISGLYWVIIDRSGSKAAYNYGVS